MEMLNLEQFWPDFVLGLFSLLGLVLRQATEIPSFYVESYGGGVGHMVAAALQSKGLVDQGKILGDLDTLKTIAAMFFVASVALAIGAVAVFGNYRQGLYFLIGPPLFYFMVTVTTETNGVMTKLGDYEAPTSTATQNKFLKYIGAIGGDVQNGEVANAGTANISLFFGAFDSLVTEVVQAVVALFLDTGNRDHLRFVARERVLSYVMMGIPESGGLPRLIQASHLGECSELNADYIRSGANRRTDKPVNLRPSSDLTASQQRAEALDKKPRVQLDYEVKRFLMAMREAERSETELADFADVTIDDPQEQMVATCEQVWNWLKASLFRLADDRLKPGSFQGIKADSSDTPWNEAYQDVIDALAGGGTAGRGAQGGNSEQKARELLAAYIYKNSISLTSHSALQGQVFGRSPFNAKKHQGIFDQVAKAEAHGGYFQLKYFAAAIPYIQGLLLYLLSIAFPFFAIFLVMPGRAMAFFVWCSLWVWVKSWDVGFAIVYVARDIFWHMLKNRTNSYNTPLDWGDPSSVYAIIFNNDPLATQNTYWELVSFLTVLVPFLTAHLCLGATGMFDMFKNSIDTTAGRFRAFETHRARRHLGNEVEHQRREQAYRVQAAFAEHARRMPARDMSPVGKNGQAMNPRGAQTMKGTPIGTDLNDGSFGGLTGGARNVSAMASYDAAGFLLQNGDARLFDQLQGELQGVYGTEARANQGVAPGAKELSLPQGFQGAHMLGDSVSIAAQEEVLGKGKGTEGATWEDVLVAGAKDKGEKLVIPHAMRGMTPLEDKVDSKVLAELIKDENHPLRQKDSATWREVMLDQAQTQRDSFTFLSAAVGRRYMPNAQFGADSMLSATQTQQILETTARTATDGSKYVELPGFQWASKHFLHGGEFPGTTEKAGLPADGASSGNAGRAPKVAPAGNDGPL